VEEFIYSINNFRVLSNFGVSLIEMCEILFFSAVAYRFILPKAYWVPNFFLQTLAVVP